MVTIALLAAGCASTRQQVPVPDLGKSIEAPWKARIYAVRPYSYAGSAGTVRVKDGETVIGDLGVRSYLCWERKPGRTEVVMEVTDALIGVMRASVTLDAEKGQTYYVQTSIGFGGRKVRQLGPEEGASYVRRCHPPMPGGRAVAGSSPAAEPAAGAPAASLPGVAPAVPPGEL